METKNLLQYFTKIGIQNLKWFPNSRKRYYTQLPEKKYRKRFVFISRVTPAKGVDIIIKAAKKLPNDYTVDLYGPIDNKFYNNNYFNNKNIEYKGIIKPEKVYDVLLQYDVLLLPSYFYGEGYPGVIIEALNLGMPVITTKWMALPEIVQNTYNGLLIPTKNIDALVQAILSISSDSYVKLSKNAYESFQNFDKDLVLNKLINHYKNLASNKQ